MEEDKNKTVDIFVKHFEESKQYYDKDKKFLNQGNYVGAYIKTISEYINQSNDSTLLGLYGSIKDTTEFLSKKLIEKEIIPKTRTTLSLKAVSEVIIHLLHKYTSKKTNEDLSTIKTHLVNITNDLYVLSYHAKDKISSFFSHSIKNGCTILVHGYSSTIAYSLIQGRKQGKRFKVYITKAQPDDCGTLMEEELKKNDIDAKVILDIAIGFYMKDVDYVLVGADAVCENGGIINKIGTFTLAICAKNFKKPFYVMIDSLKFLKIYPLDQVDVQQSLSKYIIEEDQVCCDYTPPEFITLLFTDIGILTPSAVSDELIQVFYT